MRAPSPAAGSLERALRGGRGSGLERRSLLAKESTRKLEHAGGVGDDLDGLNAGDVVKEPAATGVHELRVALHLHELEGADALVFGERMGLVGGEEARRRSVAAVEDDVDVGVAGGPDIVEELAPSSFSKRGDSVAQLVEGLAQRGAPVLVAAGLAAVAAAVGAPAFDAVHAAPGGVVDNFALVLGRKLREEAGVVGELDGLVFSSRRRA